jgi:SAM-dependent methyltransferase
MENHRKKVSIFLHTAIKEICRLDRPAQTKVMDFGCGIGSIVDDLLSLGYDAYGCDLKPYWLENPRADIERLAAISSTPYQLPFGDNLFDVVVSTSVLEHAQNKKECFQEIYRILRTGGYSMHLFPAKWYLPLEPHIYVPLVNMLWPSCPKWWFALWALLGVRNEFQGHKSWKEVVEENCEYCRHNLSYWSNNKYRKVSLEVFESYSAPMEFYINNGYGGFPTLFRRLPFKRLSGWCGGQVRMNFIVQRKLPRGVVKTVGPATSAAAV